MYQLPSESKCQHFTHSTAILWVCGKSGLDPGLRKPEPEPEVEITGVQAIPRLDFQPCVSPRSSPQAGLAGSLLFTVFTLLFWTNHRQACPILAGKSLIGQCCHRSTKMAAVAEDCRRLRSFRVFLACLKLRNSEKIKKKDC